MAARTAPNATTSAAAADPSHHFKRSTPMEHRLQLDTALDRPGADHILYWLRAIPGVNSVEANAGASQVRVLYDGDLTSSREIDITATRAGFPVRQARAGGCC